jgi:gentisate 1,2-dioxygenase
MTFALRGVDVLNVPLVESLNATVFEFDYDEPDTSSHNRAPRAVQSVRYPLGHSQKLYSSGGLLPTFATERRGTTPHSPMFMYSWERTREALAGLRDYEGSPYDGIMLEYVDPTSGRPVMPSMSFRSQLLRPGEKTAAHREMASKMYVCLEGSGSTQVGDTILEWSRNDVFAVPNWEWHHHLNTASGDAVLYSVTDAPAMKTLGLYQHQEIGPDGNPRQILT